MKLLLKQRPKPRSQSLRTSSINYKHIGEKRTSSKTPLYSRRTISIAQSIHKWIQDFRADAMKRDPDIEYDYTTMANYLMAYGIRYASFYTMSEKDHEFTNDLVGDRLELGRYGLIDALEDVEQTRNRQVKHERKGVEKKKESPRAVK